MITCWIHTKYIETPWLHVWLFVEYLWEESWWLKCLIPFKGQYNRNGKHTIYAHPLCLAPLFSPLPPISTNVNITATLKNCTYFIKWVEINIKFYFPFCHNTFFMSKTLAFESTFNICIHHFEFHTFGENHMCPYLEHVNTDTITLKSV